MRNILIFIICLILTGCFSSTSSRKAGLKNTIVSDSQALEQDQVRETRHQLKECLDKAFLGYVKIWKEACLKGGRSDNCFLRDTEADLIEKGLKENYSQCHNDFPIKKEVREKRFY